MRDPAAARAQMAIRAAHSHLGASGRERRGRAADTGVPRGCVQRRTRGAGERPPALRCCCRRRSSSSSLRDVPLCRRISRRRSDARLQFEGCLLLGPHSGHERACRSSADGRGGIPQRRRGARRGAVVDAWSLHRLRPRCGQTLLLAGAPRELCGRSRRRRRGSGTPAEPPLLHAHLAAPARGAPLRPSRSPSLRARAPPSLPGAPRARRSARLHAPSARAPSRAPARARPRGGSPSET